MFTSGVFGYNIIYYISFVHVYISLCSYFCIGFKTTLELLILNGGLPKKTKNVGPHWMRQDAMLPQTQNF